MTILAFQVLTKHRREFQQGLLAAYVDLCQAFDSSESGCPLEDSWSSWSVTKTDVMSELDYGTESAVRFGDTISDLFPVVTGVRQGGLLAPTLLSACMDWILGRMSEKSSCFALFQNVKISDLNFADDAVILRRLWISFWGPSRY